MQHRYKRYRFLARRRARRINKRLERHPFVMPIIVVLSLIGLSAGLFFGLSGRSVGADDANIVMLYADRKTSSIPTREETVGGFLEKADVVINEGDVVEPSLDTKIQEDNFHINVYRAAPVVLLDGSTKIYGLSAAQTPRTMAEQVGAKLYPEDSVVAEPSDNFLKDGGIGSKVVIDRAVPAVLNLYGTSLAIRTQADTVEQLLKEKNVVLEQDDTVTPAKETVITPQTQIFVARNGTQVVTTEETIVAPVQTIEDTALSFGTTVTRQQGSNGKRSVTYQINLQNGVEVSRSIIQEIIVLPPVTQIVARGRAVAISGDKESWMRGAGIPESDYAFVNFIISRESGWCPTKWQGQVGYCPAYYTDLHPITSGFGFGLCQSTPAAKMASAGADWQTNPITQMRWCSGYAIGRYGTWEKAYEFWSTNHWW